MLVRLYVHGYSIPVLKHRDFEWPAPVPFPTSGDFVTFAGPDGGDEVELEVDHLELFPEQVPHQTPPHPLVAISFKATDQSLGDEWK